MNDTTHDEWHRLFSGALNDTLTSIERQLLMQLLKANAHARELWFLYNDNECGLAELRLGAAMTGKSPAAAREESRLGSPRWQQWRPMTAAVAGLMLGLFSASMVLGFVSQRGGRSGRVFRSETRVLRMRRCAGEWFSRGRRTMGWGSCALRSYGEWCPGEGGDLHAEVGPAGQGHAADVSGGEPQFDYARRGRRVA